MRKKGLVLRFVFLLLLFASAFIAATESPGEAANWIDFADTGWYDDDSNKTSFEISTAEQLAGLAKLVNEGNRFLGKIVTLKANIDLSVSGRVWTPIGVYGTSETFFSGAFDGDGHTISGMTITGWYEGSVGLFAIVTRGVSGNSIKNLFLTDMNIDVSSTADLYAGGIAGCIHDGTTVSGCKSSGSLSVDSAASTGGIVGYNVYGTVSGCEFSGIVSADKTELTGGIVGYNASGTVSECKFSGIVSADRAGATGRFGVEATGGIVGYNSSGGEVSKCEFSGSVRSTTFTPIDHNTVYAGGIVGHNVGGTVSGCKATGKVSAFNTGSGAEYAGGIIGCNYTREAEPTTVTGNRFSRIGTGQQWGIGWNGSFDTPSYAPSNDGTEPYDGTENAKCPIIVIPGIMGSELFNDAACTDQIWLPGNLSIDDGAMDVNHFLHVEYPTEQHDAFFKTYGTEFFGQTPGRKLMDDLLKTFPKSERELYFFSYDWRKSCADAANELGAFLDKKGFAKVDIVAHSMGGRVASSYFRIKPWRFNKLITLATPYEGSPEAIVRALHDFKLMDIDGVDQILSCLGKITPAVKRGYPSLSELAPSLNYHYAEPTRQMRKNSNGTIDVFGITPERYYAKVLVEIFGSNDHWFRGDSAPPLEFDGAYFAIGMGEATIRALVLTLSDTNTDALTGCIYGDGDGTVPFLSASSIGEITNLESFRWRIFNASHAGILDHDGARQWVIDILKQGYSTVLFDVPKQNPHCLVRVACPVNAAITKGSETLTSKSNEYSDLASFGRMDILGKDGEIKMFYVDEGNWPVRMEGTAVGSMDYSITFYDKDNNLVEERIIEGVAITDKTVITSDTDKSKPTVLNVDDNGDGIVDRTITVEKSNSVTPSNPSDPSTPSNPSNPSTPSNESGGGGGGCDAGFGAVLLILAGLSWIKLKK